MASTSKHFLFNHSKRSYYSKWIFNWLILYLILNYYCNILILELMLGCMRVRLGINIPNQHLQQCFFMYWGYKNLFSYQNIRNLAIAHFSQMSLLACITAFCITWHMKASFNYSQNYSDKLHNIILFLLNCSHPSATHSNKISPCLDPIKKCIPEIPLLHT